MRKQQIPDKDSLGKADLDKGNFDKDKLSVWRKEKMTDFYVIRAEKNL